MNTQRRFEGCLEQLIDEFRDQGLTRMELIGTLEAAKLMAWLLTGVPGDSFSALESGAGAPPRAGRTEAPPNSPAGAIAALPA
jgi:hypothetical protein